MGNKLFLTFNAGSSTIKIGVYEHLNAAIKQVAFVRVNLHEHPISLEIQKGLETRQILLKARLTEGLHEVINELFGFFESELLLDKLYAVGHRVVHGGDLFLGPVILDQKKMAALEGLIPLAPLHQPQALFIIRAIESLRPYLKQTASFDTAFHQTQASAVRHYAIPEELFHAGIKRYGFHGLSYQYIQSYLSEAFPGLANSKVIIAHLGSGASLCAMDHGMSQDSSMGFSTLSGVPMETRCGDIDASAVLYLAKEKGMGIEQIAHLLYQESGLLGLSGESGNTRDLLMSNTPGAHLALDVFILRIAGEIGRMISTLNGLDALVFTGGIGENQAEIRSRICAKLSWLGIELDSTLNDQTPISHQIVSSKESKVKTLVIPTNEEDIIAKQLINILHDRK